jgi:hypothetical protein
MRRFALASAAFVLSALVLLSQDPKTPKPPEVENAAPPQEPAEAEPDFTCPMDPDVKQKSPGKCPRCGMALVPGIPDALEYPVKLQTNPSRLKAGEKARLTLWVNNPKTGKQETKFQIVHDKYFHLFLLSQDLKHFAHEHPEVTEDKKFVLDFTFPAPGYYRVLSDFYPDGGAPQMVANSLFVPGPGFRMGFADLKPDLAPQKGENMTVSLRMEPEQPVAGLKTLMFFKIEPGNGLEQYLAAWGHMLAASWDSVDMVHNHPFIADGGPNIQFNMIFPRAGVYRVWVQFQRQGVVNTVAFNVPVTELK